MATDPDIKAYPFQFDPSQFANPYTQWNKQALPFMGLYAGGATGPTDARGNPIQSYQDALAAQKAAQAAAVAAPPAKGTTLNSNAALEALGSPARAMQNAGYGDWAMLDPTLAASSIPGQTAGAGSVGGTAGWNPANPTSVYPTSAGATAAQPPQAAAPAGPDTNAAYLAALANPGKVTTPGATVAQSAPPSAQSGVLQQFLANWKPGANPAGNYNPNLFPDALRGMV